MKTLLPIFIPILFFSSFLNGQQMVSHSADNGNFKFKLPAGCEVRDQELLDLMNEHNPFIQFIAICSIDSNKGIAIAVSKYTNDSKVSIDEAYQLSVETVGGQNLGLEDAYKLIDHKVYQKNGKTLRYKISETFEGINSIMFYFMKNDFSNELFEVKITAKSEDRKEALDYGEKIALSVGFK